MAVKKEKKPKKPRTRLLKKQREALLVWISEGLETDEINKRAGQFSPTFKVSRSLVDHYRKTRKVDIKEIILSGEITALKEGLAVKASRVKLLQVIADLMMEDLIKKELLWTNQVKSIGSQYNFERIDYKEFNTAEVQQLRGVLEDIAKELGERSPDVNIENNNFFDIESWKKEREKRLASVKALPAR
jgi:hypothetical protein